MSDNLFNLLSTEGERFLSADTRDRVTSYIAGKDWLLIDVDWS